MRTVDRPRVRIRVRARVRVRVRVMVRTRLSDPRINEPSDCRAIIVLVKHHNKWYLQTELNSPYCIPLDMLSLQIVFFFMNRRIIFTQS